MFYNLSVNLLIFFGVCIAIFILLREFWCWYWKINEKNTLLREIRDSLIDLQKKDHVEITQNMKKSIIDVAEPDIEEIDVDTTEPEPELSPVTWKCPRCGTINDDTLRQCPKCGVFRQE